MTRRSSIHEQFVERFAFGESEPFTDADLTSIENVLDTKLPSAFREFSKRFGRVYTPSILRNLVDRGLDHPDLQEFLSATEAIANTQGYWSAGMPLDVIGIASDSMGNMIGFCRTPKAAQDAPVLFFDHDFVTVKEIATSFDEYLEWYLLHLGGS